MCRQLKEIYKINFYCPKGKGTAERKNKKTDSVSGRECVVHDWFVWIVDMRKQHKYCFFLFLNFKTIKINFNFWCAQEIFVNRAGASRRNETTTTTKINFIKQLLTFWYLLTAPLRKKPSKLPRYFPEWKKKKNSTAALLTHYQRTSSENFIHVEKLRAFEKR